MKGYLLQNDDGTVTHANATASSHGVTKQQMDAMASTIPAAQVQSDWTQTSNAAMDFVKNKPATYYSGTRKHTEITYHLQTTVSGGNAVFIATNNGLIGGTAVFNTIWIESAHPKVFQTSNAFFFGAPVLSGDKKTITMPVTRLSYSTSGGLINLLGAAIQFLTGFNFINAADGTVVHLTISGE